MSENSSAESGVTDCPVDLYELDRLYRALPQETWDVCRQQGGSYEIRAVDTAPDDKYHWPFRLLASIPGQRSPCHEEIFSFVAGVMNAWPQISELARGQASAPPEVLPEAPPVAAPATADHLSALESALDLLSQAAEAWAARGGDEAHRILPLIHPAFTAVYQAYKPLRPPLGQGLPASSAASSAAAPQPPGPTLGQVLDLAEVLFKANPTNAGLRFAEVHEAVSHCYGEMARAVLEPGSGPTASALGRPFMTAHSGGPDGCFVRLKYASLREMQTAHSTLVALMSGRPAGTRALDVIATELVADRVVSAMQSRADGYEWKYNEARRAGDLDEKSRIGIEFCNLIKREIAAQRSSILDIIDKAAGVEK